VTSELRAQPGQAQPGEAWVRDEGQRAGEGQGAPVVHPGRHRRAPEARSSYREVFAIGEFRALWSAQVLSFAGDQFAQVAIAILVYGRTHSPFLTALAYALTYLPPIAGGPLLSGLADLFPRRRVMIVCDLLRIGTVGLMAVPGLPFTALCVLLFCTVLTGVPFSSARAALMPDVLPGDKFVLGSAIGNITFQASQILGFVAGAAVVACSTRIRHWPSKPRRSPCRPSSSWPECGAARRRPGPAGPGPRYGRSPRTASGSSSVAACC
jgi:hypothetical protein